MPSIRERSASPPKRLIVRIAVAVVIVLAAYLYARHVSARDAARHDAAVQVLALLAKGQVQQALASGVAAQQRLGTTPELSRSVWAALMASGGQQGPDSVWRRTLAYTPHDPRFSLMFSNDGRFLAAIDGNTITVWNVENGQQVLTTQGGDRFIGYWRIGARHFGLFASYQYYDLVNSVIELPDGYRYAQPSKDSLTAVAPGGDWAYRAPAYAEGRTDYPIKLVNLRTGEKREVDVNYLARYGTALAVNSDATRIANKIGVFDFYEIGLWDARKRTQVAMLPNMENTLYFSKAMGAVIIGAGPLPGLKRAMDFFDSDTGKALFFVSAPGETGARAIADDPKGVWFAVQTAGTIKLYRGMNSPVLSIIAENEVSRRAPATSR